MAVTVFLVPLTPHVHVLRFDLLPLKPNPQILGPLLLLLAKFSKRLVTLPNIVGIGMINQRLNLLVPTSLNYPSLKMRQALLLFWVLLHLLMTLSGIRTEVLRIT